MREGCSLSKVVFVTIQVLIIQRFDVAGAESIGCTANGVVSSSGAMLKLVHAVALSVQIIEHLSRLVGGERKIVL